MVVNFRTCDINQNTIKLTTLIKKKIYLLTYHQTEIDFIANKFLRWIIIILYIGFKVWISKIKELIIKPLLWVTFNKNILYQ
jgi:hypothetical protein